MTDVGSDSPTPPLWKRGLPVVGWAGALVLGAVLGFSAWAKALDPQAFTGQIRTEGLDFLLSAEVVAFLALALEIALGTALVLGLRRLWVLVPASLLVAFFLFLNGRAYWDFAHGIVDETASCGCFGNLVERNPAEAFWQDLFLLVPGLAIAFIGRSRSPFPKYRLSVVAGLTVGGLVFTAMAPELPLDDLATRLKPGKSVAQICAGGESDRICLASLMPEIEEGEHLVVLADLEDPAFGEAVDRLNGYVLSGSGPPLWVLTASSDETQHTFFWQWGPTFEIRTGPETLLRPLYRRLPRSFLVSDGEVTRTFGGLPPHLPDEEPSAGDTT